MILLNNGIVDKSFDAADAIAATGTPFALPYLATQVQWTSLFGSNPSAVSISIQTSLDNSVWNTVVTTTTTTGATGNFLTSALFIRAKINSITDGGDVTVELVAKNGLLGRVTPSSVTDGSLVIYQGATSNIFGELVFDGDSTHALLGDGTFGALPALNPFDQNLNTSDSPSFAGLTVAGLIYPTSDGSAGDVFTTDGAGNITLQPGGGGGVPAGWTWDTNTLSGVDGDSRVEISKNGLIYSAKADETGPPNLNLYNATYDGGFTAKVHDDGVTHFSLDDGLVIHGEVSTTSRLTSNVLTEGRVLIVGASGLLEDDAELTYDKITDILSAVAVVLTDYIAVGNTPSTSGAIRLNNEGKISARNAADDSDIDLLYLDSSDVLNILSWIQIDNSTGEVSLYGNSSTTSIVDGVVIADILKTGVADVASLPICNGGSEGSIKGVNDALLPAALAIVASGGAVHVPVYCNGTNWIVM